MFGGAVSAVIRLGRNAFDCIDIDEVGSDCDLFGFLLLAHDVGRRRFGLLLVSFRLFLGTLVLLLIR